MLLNRTYEIDDNGNCDKCKCNWNYHCRAFCRDIKGYTSNTIQCQECINYIYSVKNENKSELDK